MNRIVLLSIVAGSLGALGCGVESGEAQSFGGSPTMPIDARESSVVLEGCQLDTWQTAQLASAAAQRVLRTVILLCPTIHPNGDVIPTDPDARARLAQTIGNLRAMSYAVHLAVGVADDTDVPLSPARDAQLFASPDFRSLVIHAIGDLAQMADGIELDLQGVPGSMRTDMTTFIQELGSAIHPATFLGVFVPPSTMYPSDTPSGDAYALSALVGYVDRIRVMTLDYSCCNGTPGPTIESGWAVDAVRFARNAANRPMVDIAMPLYGVDFTAAGKRSVTWLEADAVAQATNASEDRVTSGALHYKWQDEAGEYHETFYDDALSTTRVLHAWSYGALPPDVGVVFYGLGAEDPSLWDAIARGMQ
jgi:spore germination protein YaaH